jgi:hypothetical protein
LLFGCAVWMCSEQSAAKSCVFGVQHYTHPIRSIGAFPPSDFSNKLDDKLAHKVASQTNVTHFCLVCQSKICCKPNWFATNTPRQLCERVFHQVCCKNVMVETHLKQHCAAHRAACSTAYIFNLRFQCAISRCIRTAHTDLGLT